MNAADEFLRLVESIDQIACEDEIVIAEFVAKVAGIALPKFAFVCGFRKTMFSERSFFEAE